VRRLWRAYVRTGELKERALRTLNPSRLHFVPYSWPLRTTMCPCDVHLCEYLVERDIRGRSIFHFGTGGHHLVGERNRQAGLENDVLGLTLSPSEHARYVSRVIRDPGFGKHYKVLFADLYSLSADCVPDFDMVTLFHLCEFADARSAGRRMDDRQVLQLFQAKLKTGGALLFYSASFGFPRARALIAELVAAGRLRLVEEYRSLLIYRADAAASEARAPQ
jgi:hypothetical protein